jgi:hypothetical protein
MASVRDRRPPDPARDPGRSARLVRDARIGDGTGGGVRQVRADGRPRMPSHQRMDLLQQRSGCKSPGVGPRAGVVRVLPAPGERRLRTLGSFRRKRGSGPGLRLEVPPRLSGASWCQDRSRRFRGIEASCNGQHLPMRGAAAPIIYATMSAPSPFRLPSEDAMPGSSQTLRLDRGRSRDRLRRLARIRSRCVWRARCRIHVFAGWRSEERFLESASAMRPAMATPSFSSHSASPVRARWR